MTETMCAKADVQLKAGAWYNTAITDGKYTTLINQAESHINAVTRINYTDTYAALNVDVQKILQDAASSYAARMVIAYDLSNYPSLAQAQTLIDVNQEILQRCLSLLKEKEVTKFVDGA
jgi:TRAP-type mannitol/chloroaromatic compound transport system substrate-binding protein